MDFLRSFGAHAAVAIEGAALLGVASSRLRRLETLREIEGEISGQRDRDALVALISRRAAELLDADTGGVYLLDEAGKILRPHAAFNWPAWMQGVPITMGEGVIGVTAARGQGMIVNDFPRSPLALAPFRDVHRAVVTQPLVAGPHAPRRHRRRPQRLRRAHSRRPISRSWPTSPSRRRSPSRTRASCAWRRLARSG